MSKRPYGRRWSAANGCCRDRFLDSSLAYQGEAGGLGIEAVRDLHRFGSLDFLPDRTLVLTLDEAEGAVRARARDGNLGDRIGSRPPSYHAAVDAGFRRDGRARSRTGSG